MSESNVRYRITVTRLWDETCERKHWRQVADTGNPRDNGPQYDYAGTMETKTEEASVFQQAVSGPDDIVKRVAAVVNGLFLEGPAYPPPTPLHDWRTGT